MVAHTKCFATFPMQAGATPGFLAGLLQLSVMDEAPAEVRQMAAIQFKNTVHRSWVCDSSAANDPMHCC